MDSDVRCDTFQSDADYFRGLAGKDAGERDIAWNCLYRRYGVTSDFVLMDLGLDERNYESVTDVNNGYVEAIIVIATHIRLGTFMPGETSLSTWLFCATKYATLRTRKRSSGMEPTNAELLLSVFPVIEGWFQNPELQKMLAGNEAIYEKLPQLFRSVENDSKQYEYDWQRMEHIQERVREENRRLFPPVAVPFMVKYRWQIVLGIFVFLILAGIITLYILLM